MMIEGETILQMSRTVDFARWADIPLEVNTNITKMVAFETSLRIPRVVSMKQTVYRYSMYGSCSQDFLVYLRILNSQFNGSSERRGRCRGDRLRIGCRSHLGRISFNISHKLRHIELVKEGKEIFLNGLLDGTQGVATSANTGREGG